MKKLFLMILYGMFLFQACGDDDDNKNDPELLTVPKLVTSTPANNATNVDLKTATIELLFDCEITVVSTTRIKLNGTSVSAATANGETLTVILPSLSSQTVYTLTLEALAIKAIDGGVNSEVISVIFTTGSKPEILITANLAVTNPSQQAINVYNFLKENYGEKSISSTMANVNWNINEAEWVYQHTGKYPAIATFDYIHLMSSPANWIDYSQTDFVEEWWNNKGLISASWHWNVPTASGSTSYTYKPSETTFSTANAVVAGTWENDVVKADLEKMAGYLKLLQAKNIPVIWRPLHEAAGNIYEYTGGTAWFWWGADGATAFKNLWIYMFDYFEAEGLNNLIWVWTTQTKDKEFYPGDDYVDIVGRDIYNNSVASNIEDQFSSIQESYPNKMVTLSEFGNVASFSSQWNAGATWSYFMPWYDYTRTLSTSGTDFESTNHEFANIAWWTDAFANDAVTSRDEMPDLK